MPDKIKTVELNSGEYVAIKAKEIIAVPMLSVIENSFPQNTDVEKEYRQGFGNLLSEVFQNYSNIKYSNNTAEIAVEMIWLTEAVQNQSYKAKIRLFMVLRAVAQDKNSALNYVNRLETACTSVLHLYKYEAESIAHDDMDQLIGNIPDQSVYAVVKDEREERFQNAIIPACFGFDVFDAYANHLDSIINSLIDYPNCVISIQIIPTHLTEEENAMVTQISQALGMLSKGIMEQGVGNISFSETETLANTYKHYVTNRNSALFMYNIVVMGDDLSTENIASKMLGYINSDTSKQTAVKKIRLNKDKYLETLI